jgi:hypothetical protein
MGYFTNFTVAKLPNRRTPDKGGSEAKMDILQIVYDLHGHYRCRCFLFQIFLSASPPYFDIRFMSMQTRFRSGHPQL